MSVDAHSVHITHVQPAYGKTQVLVRWALNAPELLTGMAVLYRSWDGGREFQKVNKTPIPASDLYLVDTEVDFIDSSSQPLYFLRIAIPGTTKFVDSMPAYPRDRMSLRDYGIVRRLMNLKLIAYSRGRDGRKVWLYKRPIDGKPCPNCTDPETGQINGISQCTECHGTGFEGGFGAPYLTWVHIGKVSPLNNSETGDGDRLPDTITKEVTALAFPVIRTGDMIVEPMRDVRLVAGDKVTINSFMDEYPIDCQFVGTVLRRGDVKFKIVPPPFPPCDVLSR